MLGGQFDPEHAHTPFPEDPARLKKLSSVTAVRDETRPEHVVMREEIIPKIRRDCNQGFDNADGVQFWSLEETNVMDHATVIDYFLLWRMAGS